MLSFSLQQMNYELDIAGRGNITTAAIVSFPCSSLEAGTWGRDMALVD